jgi:hypothetical protein
MPKVVDPDNLARNVSVTFQIADTEARFIELSSSLINPSSNIPPLESGSDSGVTGQALYSFCKEQWKAQEDLIKIPFPLVSITKNQFDFTNNWDLQDDAGGAASGSSRLLIRDAGWSVISASLTIDEYVGIVTLGTLGTTDQVYYQQLSFTGSAVNFAMSGTVNQAIQHFSQSDVQVEFNSRAYTKLFVREYQKTYDDASIQDDLNVPTQEYVVYSLPLTNATDLDINTTLEGQATGSPYDEVEIDYLTGSYFGNYQSGSTLPSGAVVVHSLVDDRWFIGEITGGEGNGAGDSPGLDTLISWITWSASIGGGERQIGAGLSQSYFAFNRIIDGGVGQNNSINNIYTRVQYELRLGTDIDDGTQDNVPRVGNVTDTLLRFLGPTLITSNGVFIDNFQDADTNSIDFFDVSGTVRRFPFVSAGTINFNDNLINDAVAEYFMFFTSVDSGSFGSASAVIVEDNDDIPITGSVSGSSSVAFTFDYDNNAQGGRTAGSDAAVTVVAIGLSTAQYVSAVGTIDRSKTVSITLVSALERNYSNP